MLDLKDFGLFRAAVLRSFSVVWNSVQFLCQTSDTERSRRRWYASTKVHKKGGREYTYTGSFSYHADYRRQEFYFVRCFNLPTTTSFIPQTRTPGLDRREWPARLNISWVHIQSMTGPQSTTLSMVSEARGWYQSTHPPKTPRGRQSVRTPRVSKSCGRPRSARRNT